MATQTVTDLRESETEVISEVTNRLGEVALMMLALHDLAVEIDNGVSAGTLATTTEHLSWRAGQILDGCIRKLGSPGLGYFDDERNAKEVTQ